ncbi:MAG TPA: methyltransferase domain-containing protein [Gaiellaceae bacterium]
MAPRWERGRDLLWRGTRPVSEWLVSRLDAEPGQTILDVAAGSGDTGFLAAPGLGPDGKLITSDRERAMVEAAERRAEELGIQNAEFRVLDSDRLDIPDASIDGVLNRFGYILKGDPPRALAEIRRVLRRGGHLAFAVWAARERNPWMTVPAEAMVERGHLAPQTDAELRLSARRNPDAIARLLAQAGFGTPEIEEMEVSYRFADAEELWFFVSELRGPVALALAGLPDAEREAVRAEIEAKASVAGDGFELGGVSLNVAAS